MDAFTPPAWPPYIHFRDWPVPPPPLAYIREDDYLAVTVLTSSTTSGLALRYRILQAAGGVIDGAESLDGAETSTLTTHVFKLTEGFLLSATVSNIGGGLADSVCGVIIALQKGGQASTAPHTILAQGYVSNIIGVTWPVGLPRGPATSGSSLAQAYLDSLADLPPSSPGSLDDEFDGATLNTTTRWTWVNQGTATATLAKSYLQLLNPGTGAAAIVQAAPAAQAWEVTTKLEFFCDTGNYPGFGFVARESSTGKMQGVRLYNQATYTPTWYVDNWSDINTVATDLVTVSGLHAPGPRYFRVRDNTTNLVWSWSPNGCHWTQVLSVSRTSYMAGGPDQVGIIIFKKDLTLIPALYSDFFRRTL